MSLHLSSNIFNISISFESLEMLSLKCSIFASFSFHNFSITPFECTHASSINKIFLTFSYLLRMSYSASSQFWSKKFPFLSSNLLLSSIVFSVSHYRWSIVTISQIAKHNSILFVSLEKDLLLKCSIFDTFSYHHLSIPQFTIFLSIR